MQTTVLSFGFKHGLPLDVDIVLDCRFLPNPYWVDRLRDQTGLDPEVRDYVLGQPATGAFLDHLDELFDLLMPAFAAEGKSYLTIAFGCTGGRHRSVTLAEELAAPPAGQRATRPGSSTATSSADPSRECSPPSQSGRLWASRYRSRSRAISAVWWISSRFVHHTIPMNGNLGVEPPRVLTEAHGVELGVAEGVDAVAPALHQGPEPLDGFGRRAVELDVLGSLTRPAERPLVPAGHPRLEVAEAPGDGGQRRRIGRPPLDLQPPLAAADRLRRGHVGLPSQRPHARRRLPEVLVVGQAGHALPGELARRVELVEQQSDAIQS